MRNVRLLGVGMRDTAISYLDAHSMPSGGDWGLGRIAAVFIKGAVGTVIDSCAFQRLPVPHAQRDHLWQGLEEALCDRQVEVLQRPCEGARRIAREAAPRPERVTYWAGTCLGAPLEPLQGSSSRPPTLTGRVPKATGRHWAPLHRVLAPVAFKVAHSTAFDLQVAAGAVGAA